MADGVRANLRHAPFPGKGERRMDRVSGRRAPVDGGGYRLAGRVFMMLSISPISRGALLIRSRPRSVIT